MKKHQTAIACSCVLLMAVIIVGWMIHLRSLKNQWQGEQLKNAAKLGAGLSEYHGQYGHYPKTLSELVDEGIIQEGQFEQLRFRISPYADPVDWLYKTPQGLTEIAIVAPHWIENPKNKNLDAKPLARADGGGELVIRNKKYRVPEWAAENRVNKSP